MKILITGITGLLGSHLARKFAPLGTVHGLRRPNSNPRLLGEMTDKIVWHDGDINDYQSLEAAFDGMDLIIHCAGLVSYEPSDESKLMKINVEGTVNVVNVMLEKGIANLIHISSVSAFGRSHEIKIIDENHKWTDSGLNTPYAISKYLGELEVWRAAQEGLKVLVVNPSILLGKISDQRSSTQIYNYVLEEHKYYPKGTINFLDVRDAAELVVRLYQDDAWGQRFILNNQAISYKEFFEILAKAFDKKAPYKAVSPSLLKIALLSNWLGKKIGISKLPLNKQTATIAKTKVTMDNSKVNKRLGFRYTPLQDTLEWAKTNEKS